MTFVAMTRKRNPASLYVVPALLAVGEIRGAVGHLTLRGKKGGMETDKREGGGERRVEERHPFPPVQKGGALFSIAPPTLPFSHGGIVSTFV